MHSPTETVTNAHACMINVQDSSIDQTLLNSDATGLVADANAQVSSGAVDGLAYTCQQAAHAATVIDTKSWWLQAAALQQQQHMLANMHANLQPRRELQQPC